MKKIKLLSIFTATLITATCTIGLNAEATEFAQKVTKERYLTEEDVFAALAYTFDDNSLKSSIKSKNKFSPSGALTQGFDAKSYSEYTGNDYGGMYLDENGTLVLCYVDGSETIEFTEEAATRNMSKSFSALKNEDNEIIADSYKIKAVKYSEQELLDAYDLVNKVAEEKGIIKSAGIDVFENRVIVGIKDISAIEEIEKDLVAICGVYAFELNDDSDYHNCSTIKGTSAIHNNSTTNKTRSSVAGKVYNDVFSGWGIVTCGHGWHYGDSVYYGNTKIGTIKRRTLNSTNDSSLIQLGSGHNYKDVKNDEIDSSVPVVGSSMTLRGYASGIVSGAKVLQNNASQTIDGLYCTNMIKCDKSMKNGDSGGGAIGKYVDGGRTALILGINRATNSAQTLLVKGKVICDAY